MSEIVGGNGEANPETVNKATIFYAEKEGDNVHVKLGTAGGFNIGELLLAKEILDLEIKKLLANKLAGPKAGPKIQSSFNPNFLNNLRKGLHKR